MDFRRTLPRLRLLFALACASLCISEVRAICVENGERPAQKFDLNCTSTPQYKRYCCKTAADAVNVSECVPRPWSSSACQGGYYESADGPALCPSGFYCPENSLCLVRCSQGASCIRPVAMWNSTCRARGGKAADPEQCCQPYYELAVRRNASEPENFTCGGAPNDQPCPRGHYCPTPSAVPIPCPSGHYCREGTVSPQRCPLLATCPRESSAPRGNALGLVLDLVLVLFLLLVLWVYNNRHDLLDHLESYRDRHLGSRTVQRWTQWRARNHSVKHNKFLAHVGVNLLIEADGVSRPQEPDTVDYADPQLAVKPKTFPIRIAFKNMCVSLKSGKTIVDDVTGEIKPGRLTAILGGSGTGKSTFLNALAGKVHYARVDGVIKVNGRSVSLSDPLERYRSVMGFVPQEDIMHRNLSVHEVLHYQANLRLCRHSDTSCAALVYDNKETRDEIAKKVSQAGRLLGLLTTSADRDSVWYKQIGSAEKRGISGGERKRVNIGMELVADPTVLFLDEPTSGLDSVGAQKVVELLRHITKFGNLTVVMVVHQPRYDVFRMFDDVILLQKGGSIAFQGSPDEAEDYFTQLTTQLDYPGRGPNTNPPDFYLDVIAQHYDEVSSLDGRNVDSVKAKHLSVLWRERQRRWKEHEMATRDPDASESDSDDGGDPNFDDFKAVVRPSTLIQFWIFLRRLGVLMIRNVRTLLLDQFLALLAGSVLGALFSEVELERVYTVNVMSGLAIGLTGMLAALRSLGTAEIRPVFWREAASGVNRLAYFLAVIVAHVPIIIVTPLVYLSLFYTFTAPRTSFSDYYLIVLMTYWCTYGYGYLLSTIFHPNNSKMAAVVVGLIASTLTGSNPTLCKLNKYTFIGPAAYSLSYSRWYGEAVFEKEALEYPPVFYTRVQYLAGRNDYPLDNFPMCMGMLFLFGVLTRMAAFVLLIATHRGKQK